MLDQDPPSTQVFEYRPHYKHYGIGIQHRISEVAVVILIIAILMFLLIVQVAAPITDMSDFWQRFISKTADPEVIFLLPLLLFPLLTIGAVGALWLGNRSKLIFTKEELIYARNLPLGFDSIVPDGWRVKLAKITDIQIIYNPVITGPNEIIIAKIHLRDKTGVSHMITPSMWFVPGSPPRPPLKPVQSSFLSMKFSDNWRSTENKAILQKAFADFPVIRELNARKLIVPDYSSSVINQLPDLFAHRSVQFGIVTGLGLIVAAILLMIFRQNNHLQTVLPIWIYVALVSSVLYLFWKIDQKDVTPAPIGNRVMAVIFLVGGVILSASQIVSLLNGLGVGSGHEQAFIIRSVHLEPANAATEIGSIELPGKNSRHAWLKEGTEVTLVVKKGRLGLWEFNDEPLRELADQQGIR